MTPLRLGVIGVGHLGKEHARILSEMSGVCLVGVADVNATQAATVADRCGAKAFNDYRPLLDIIDAAVIAVPTCHHHAVAMEVMGRGIAALIEKPLAATHLQAQEIEAAANRSSSILQIGHIERFNPAFESLQSRPLTAKYIFAERMGGYTGRSIDVGVVLDLMIHDIDLSLALVQSSLTTVEALGVSVLGGPEDMATARLTFANGCVADLRASRLASAPSRRMQVWGPEGFASIDFARKSLSLMQPSAELCRHRSGQRPFDAAVYSTMKQELFGRHLQTMEWKGECDQLTCELREFVRCVRTREQPRVSGKEACAAMEVADQVLQAIARHRWDGPQGKHVGPNAFAMPALSLFTPPEPGLAA